MASMAKDRRPSSDKFGDSTYNHADEYYTGTSAYPTGPSVMDDKSAGQSNLNRVVSTGGKTSNSKPLYHDEESDYYARHTQEPYTDDTSLVKNAGHPRASQYEDLEVAEPHQDPYATNRALPSDEKKKSPFAGFLASGRYPIEQRIEDKKRGIGRQRYPFVVWALTIAMIAVFINELVVNSRAQGSPLSFKPVVNPMLGPSSSALINVGARFPPCMKLIEDVPPSTLMPCLNNTANPPDRLCTVEEICGFGGFDGKEPNQWFRFIVPIFLHAGIIHILLNMLAQLTLSAQIEREMGSGGFILTYAAAGIFGNVLGGNFSLVGVPSVGASGAIFGTIGVTWVDLFAHWRYHYRPVRKLVFMTIELLIGIAIGYIPYVDNFGKDYTNVVHAGNANFFPAHLGGFLMGLLVGTFFYPVISVTRRHKLIMWGFRLTAIPLAIILFVVLIRNFYTSDPYAACSGCRYLSCFPTASNNHCKGTGLTTTTTTSGTGF
ncbi:hypothetical protein HGRIS_008011 [Hohenbuehelia grisea]|uniref:Rhomboid-type serine protease n=1 Tax=Hohenbuehelia grisea TaxID=104357 RepID=A0ABR3J719_9AGAR